MAVVNSQFWKDVMVFVALVALGVATRMVPYYTSLESWNLNAVAAIALFGGFYFRNLLVAFAAAALPMIVGDAIIQKYDVRMMAVIYVALLLPVLLGPWLREKLGPVRIGLGSLAAAILFFVVSNGAYWWCYHSHTFAELTKTYTEAVPFFRGTLLGNLAFSALLFGLYALAANRGWIVVAKPQAETAAG
jgi:hypothetical protein